MPNFPFLFLDGANIELMEVLRFFILNLTLMLFAFVRVLFPRPFPLTLTKFRFSLNDSRDGGNVDILNRFDTSFIFVAVVVFLFVVVAFVIVVSLFLFPCLGCSFF